MLRLCSRRLSSKPTPVDGASTSSAAAAAYRRLLPKRKAAAAAERRRQVQQQRQQREDVARRVSAHLMASTTGQLELASALRARFGAGAVNVFNGPSGGGSLASSEVDAIEGVVHLSAPASGMDAPHGSHAASAFFFTGNNDGGESLSSSTCVSVWWGAEPSFEEGLLRDLQGMSGGSRLGQPHNLGKIAGPRAVMKWQTGASSELNRDEIHIDATCEPRARVLDQLAFSHALQRHMYLLLLEQEMETILSSVKRIVRQGRPSLLVRMLPRSMGGVESGARTMQVARPPGPSLAPARPWNHT